MKNNAKKIPRWNKKGQVFILLALVILLYLILLSTTIYNITQIPYIEPAPNQEQTTRYIENTISSLYELTDVAISRYSHSVYILDIMDTFKEGLTTIENFLEDHNFVAELTLDETNFSISNSSETLNPASISFSAKVSLLIVNTEIHYEATLYLTTGYYVEISETFGTENYVYCYKIQHGETSPISDCEIKVTPDTTVINLGDGSYKLDLELGQVLRVTFPHNIIVWKEV